jgi:enterochelin esterase family protein
MPNSKTAGVITEHYFINSAFLKREVKVDCYLPVLPAGITEVSLLLINDGQDLVTMHFQHILTGLYEERAIAPLFCVALHCGYDRRNEYATAKILDYEGRGTKAAAHDQFVFQELLPFLAKKYSHLQL